LVDIAEWDADRFIGDRDKYFKSANFGYIDAPATVLDMHGKIVTWYLPEVMTPVRVVSLMTFDRALN